ncbi:hypothetical protein ATANTOWER_004762 [Ataeniobius toweri]|uniref:Uncharacterized protein n=1 Tax=Ataeniobius toweri TaxID=208326 RepID=A0ABU7A4D4_9TELE|nr:hypothetical protein [Ataeniobius toweri]
MSTRALRRLKGKQRGQEALDVGVLSLGDSPEEQAEVEEEQLDTANVAKVSPPSSSKGSSRKAKKNKAQKNFSNIYELKYYTISYSSSSAYPGPGRGGSRFSRDAQMSPSPDTSSSSSGWSPRRSQASRET